MNRHYDFTPSPNRAYLASCFRHSPNNGFTAPRNRSVHKTDSVPPKWRFASLTATSQSLPLGDMLSE